MGRLKRADQNEQPVWLSCISVYYSMLVPPVCCV